MSEELPPRKGNVLSLKGRRARCAPSLERSDAVLAEEDGRRAAEATKTAKLRELREARDATKREASKK